MRKTTLLYLLTTQVLVVSGQAVSTENSLNMAKTYSLSAGVLTESLTEFADQANIRLVFNADITRGLKAPSLTGKLTVAQGLEILLKGTSLGFRITGNIVIVEIKHDTATKAPVSAKSSASQSATTLPTMTVIGKFKSQPDDPYNSNYVLPKATAGTKTDTPIMETPLNVQVISKQVLQDQQVIGLDQALKNVSGVTMLAHENNFGINYLTPVIRGFASQTFFRNGFRLQSGSASRQFANVESIEVLKGPAAVLYGQVEPGGMVNVVTKKPQSIPYYSLNQQFGSYDLYRTSLDTTGPVNKDNSLLYRMNFSYQNSNSFRDFVYTDDVFIAPTLKWTISPKTWLNVEMEYDRNNNGFDAGFIPIYNGQILYKPVNYNWGELSPIQQETFFGNVTWAHQFSDDWSIKHQTSINHATGNGDLYFPYPSINQQTVRSTRLIYDNANDTYSTNLDLTGHFATFGLSHTLLFGGDYYQLNTDLISGATSKYTPGVDYFNPVHYPFIPPQLKPYEITNTHQNADQYGLYLQDQIKLPYHVHVMGGVRYQLLHQSSPASDYLNVFTQGVTSSEDAMTPRVGLLWQPQEWLSIYSNYVESFGANTPGLIYVSENQSKPVPGTGAKQYEIGTKTEFFEGRLRATLAYYDLTKTNIAIQDKNHLCGTGFCSALIGEARSKGIELDIQGEILTGWQVITTYANTDVVITKGSDTVPYYKPGTPFFGIPQNTATFWNTYKFQQKELKGFTVGAGVNYQGYSLARKDGTPEFMNTPFRVPGFETVGLMARYSRDVGDAKISVQFNVDNLLDTRYFTGFYMNQPYGPKGEAYGVYGTPRTFMGQFSIQF